MALLLSLPGGIVAISAQKRGKAFLQIVADDERFSRKKMATANN